MLGPDPAPRRPLTSGERLLAGAFLLGFVALMLAEMLQGHDQARLSMFFMLVFWGPMLIIHELGHLWAARSVGFSVSELVIGQGSLLMRRRVGETLVVLRAVPVSGYVVPHSRTGNVERLKMAFIYFAGPGAELLVIALVALVLGPSKLLSPSDSIAVIAAQSLALAAAMGAVMNLVPLPLSDAVTDGLGMMLSAFFSREDFERTAASSYVSAAAAAIDAGDPQRALSVIAAGRARLPDSLRLRIEEATCLAACGQGEAATQILEEVRALPNMSKPLEAQALHAAAQVVLESEDTPFFSNALEACRAALRLSPEPEFLLTMGRLQLAMGHADQAAASLMTAYKATQEPAREDRCLAYLAIATHARGDDASSHLYASALRARKPGQRLNDMVQRTLSRAG